MYKMRKLPPIKVGATVKLFQRLDSSGLYLKEIAPVAIKNKDEEFILFERIKRGDEKAINEIILSNQRFVFSVAKSYAHSPEELMDLVNEGNLGMMRAIPAFDHTKGFKFISFAVYHIRQAMLSYLKDVSPIIKQSNRAKLAILKRRYKDKFFAINGRWPSDFELKDIIMEKHDNINIVDMSDLYDMVVVSNDDKYDDDNENTKIDIKLSLNDTSDNKRLEEIVDDEVVQLYDNIKNLKPIEQDVIESVFGLCGRQEETLDIIAYRLNYTKERIRQIKFEALSKLKNQIKINQL